jgi:biotin-dependent carboxylase-like uncharacterized protein
MTGILEVLATGPLTTVQGLGRPGHAHWGVPWSGAADRSSLRLANRLVGNAEDAAALEVTLGGLRVRPDADVVIALTGAPCRMTVDGRPEGGNATVEVHAGQEVAIAPPRVGLRAYLAVRGGLALPPVLGSRATDILAELGPGVVAEGDRLPVGDAALDHPEVEVAPVPEPTVGTVTLRVVLGPRADWFTRAAHRALLHEAWTADADSNRIGLRLRGPVLERAVTDELPSEGIVRGAIQVPPSGAPTLFIADHPVTGGYPVIAVVLDRDVDLAAQVRPGQTVRFTTASRT